MIEKKNKIEFKKRGVKMDKRALEAKREYARKWREQNREKVRGYAKKWRDENPEKISKYQERYWNKKAEEMGIGDE